jgi:hypothetical protein
MGDNGGGDEIKKKMVDGPRATTMAMEQCGWAMMIHLGSQYSGGRMEGGGWRRADQRPAFPYKRDLSSLFVQWS